MAMSVNSAFALLGIVAALLMRIALQRANKQLERGEKSVSEAMKGHATQNIMGLTEEENRARRETFRYIT